MRNYFGSTHQSTPEMQDRARYEWSAVADVFMNGGSGNSRGLAVLPGPVAAVVSNSSAFDDGGSYINTNKKHPSATLRPMLNQCDTIKATISELLSQPKYSGFQLNENCDGMEVR